MNLLGRANAHLTRNVTVKAFPCRLKRSIVSFTFDDFPKSAWTVGGPILAKHNALATYYVAGSFAAREVDGVKYFDRIDLVDAHARGHEIGDHTFSHHRVGQTSSSALRADLEANAAFLKTTLGDAYAGSFAYPFGDASLRTKLLLSRHFASCRGAEPGMNYGLLDLGQLRVMSLEQRRWEPGVIDRYIAGALKRPSWMILYTHDIDENPTAYGSTPAMLDEALAKFRSAGIDILPVKNALSLACFGES